VPTLFELREEMIGTSHGVGIARHALRATVFSLGDQVRAFQHGHVLLDGCKRHLVSRGQLADRPVGVHHACQDVAPRRIGQRPEQLVQVVGRCLLTYNHMVVYRSTVPPKGGNGLTRSRLPAGGCGTGRINEQAPGQARDVQRKARTCVRVRRSRVRALVQARKPLSSAASPSQSRFSR